MNITANLKLMTVTAAAFGALTLTPVVIAASQDSEAATQSIEQRWENTKDDAAAYWKEFKQDSQQQWSSTQEAFRDGWVEGKLETALMMSEHLNPFAIDIEVSDSTAYLQGEVTSDVARELATEIAKGVEGIDDVENNLKVVDEGKLSSNEKKQNAQSFGDYMNDVLLHADIKKDLIAADNVDVMAVDVTVEKSRVTLDGTVTSSAQKELIEQIVSNNPDVNSVKNNLEVKS